MDGKQFDRLLRGLTTVQSRRGALLGLVGGAVGLLGVTETEAKKHKKKHKKKKPSPPASPPPSPPAPPPPPGPPTCSDGIKNGNETGVDCGGPDCPRCPNGQGCANYNDCKSALCNLRTLTCQACATSAECGSPDNPGQCTCYQSTDEGMVCGWGGQPGNVGSCAQCPRPNFCWIPIPGGEIFCVQLCPG
jgi:hypothetical protein